MTLGKTVLAGFALALAIALPSQAEDAHQFPTRTVTVTGTIATIDNNTRAVNIQQPDGTFVAVVAPRSFVRFNELKVGDRINATYNNTVSVRPKAPGEPAIDSSESSMQRTGDMSGMKSVERKLTATVVALDPTERSITFEAANGWKYSRTVEDPAVFNRVQVGDRVDITWDTSLNVDIIQ